MAFGENSCTRNFYIKNGIFGRAPCSLDCWFSAVAKKSRIFLSPFGKTVDFLRELTIDLTNGSAGKIAFEFDGTTSQIQLATPRGIQILVADANNFFADANGNLVSASATQKITIEATDVFEKSEITGFGAVTQADFGQPLETVGMVKLEAFFERCPIENTCRQSL